MQTAFQHPDTGEACGARFDPRRKLLIVTTDDREVMRKAVPTAAEATRELIRFGVDPDEARFE